MGKSIIDKSKFRVSRNVYIISIICFSVISVFTYFGNPIYFYQAIGSLVLSVLSIGILLKTRNYKLPVYIAISASFFIHFMGFMTSSFVENQADIFWIIVISLFAFYTVGRIGSMLYLFINVGNMVAVKLLSLYNVISLPFNEYEHDIMADLNYVINLLACSILFIYLVGQILKAYEQTQQTLLEINSELVNNDAEKTTMLKEIHHRVKNNLQVIISLLRLQLFQLDHNDNESGPFQDSINRITTMALIHEKMYKGDKINNLNVQNYVEDLASDLVRSYATSTKVAVFVNSNIKSLKMDDLVPFSLILNELITNAIKHGFRNKSTGEIAINISETPIGFDLTFKDSGEWQESENGQSFGLELIDTLNGHFDGIYRKNLTPEGTEFSFNFKVF